MRDLLDRASWGSAYLDPPPKSDATRRVEAIILRSRDPKYAHLRKSERMRLAEAEIEREWL